MEITASLTVKKIAYSVNLERGNGPEEKYQHSLWRQRNCIVFVKTFLLVLFSIMLTAQTKNPLGLEY